MEPKLMAVDYAEDFLQKLTSVNFGSGKWISVQLIGSVNAFAQTKMQIDFPDQSGGTPGLIVFNGTQQGHGWAPYMIPSPPFPPVSVLNNKLVTNAGAQLTGFGTYSPDPFAIPDTVTFIKLDNNMPKSPFRVRMQIDLPSSGGGQLVFMTVRTYSKLTAGGKIVLSPAATVNIIAPQGVQKEVRINPSTLTVAQT